MSNMASVSDVDEVETSSGAPKVLPLEVEDE